MTDVLATSIGPPAPAPHTPAMEAAAPVRAATAAGRKKGPSKPASGPVYMGAFTLFACISLVLAGRMAAGEDPALGIRPGVLAQPAPPGVLQKLVITRRISVNGMTRAQMRRRGVRRVIVVHRPAAAPADAPTPAGPPAPATVAATSAPAAPGRTERRAGGGSTVATEEPASPQAGTPSAAAPAPVASAPAAPEPVAAAPAAPTPAPAPAPVVTSTS